MDSADNLPAVPAEQTLGATEQLLREYFPRPSPPIPCGAYAAD